MGFLRTLFGGGSSPRLDSFEGHPLGRAGFDALAIEDWNWLEELYGSQTASDRYHWLQGIGMSVPLDFEQPEMPDSSFPRLFIGAIWAFLAFRFRGASVASDVGDNAAEKMWSAIDQAESLLLVASQERPEDSVIPSLLLRCALGSQTYRDNLSELCHSATMKDEPCLFGGFNYLTCQTQKWLGSRDEMWAAANHLITHQPNSAWLGLKARAHIEDWLWFMGFEDNASAKSEFMEHHKSAEYRHEIEVLDDAFWNSLGPDIPRSEILFANNNFGYLLHQLKLTERARRHVDAIGSHRSQTPWMFTLGDDHRLKRWNRVRTSLGLPKLDA